MGQHPFLYVERLTKRHAAPQRGADPLVVFEDITFGVERGAFASLIGHSGCGKSTILNIIAGITTASEGYVFVDGREVTGPGLSRGVIFQNHNLLPWKTALENVEFAVRARHRDWNAARVRAHSRQYLELVGLSKAEERRPAQLSGGMRQRVGIARAFAIEPRILLMDEPFGALDALTRGSLQDQLALMCRKTGQTVLMITHDVDEAIYLSDHLLCMSPGPRASIACHLSVGLPRPRRRAELADSAEYGRLRRTVLEFLSDRAPPVTSPEPALDPAPTPATTQPTDPTGAPVGVQMREESP
jgi:nitrate/nitrite transport system ATP-binding protein